MALQKWKQISEKILFIHPRLTVIEDIVEVPSGAQLDYIRFKYTGDAATIVVVDSKGRILLQREYSYPPDEIMWQFPGGGIPLGEDIAAGAARELAEEAGLKARKLQLIGKYCMDNRRTSAQMYSFVATGLSPAPTNPDPYEFTEHHWFTEKQIASMIAAGKIANGHFLANWTLYKNWQATKNSTKAK